MPYTEGRCAVKNRSMVGENHYMPMKGFFEMTTPAHLLHKLERDYEAWKQEPLNIDRAWNFFVTAEHLPDWLARTGSLSLGGLKITTFKQHTPLLRICSHLANGGKHFRPSPKQHTSVASTRHQGGWVPLGWVPPGWVPLPALIVDLTPDEQQALSSAEASIKALNLAADVLAFWRARM
jgi:hypothetical protein